eukprot:164170_1
MPNFEIYGMIIYGGGTTILFLIISVLAHIKLNDDNPSTSIFQNISLPTGRIIISQHGVHKRQKLKHNKNKSQSSPQNHTLFPFNASATDMHQNNNNDDDESLTEKSNIFS